MDVEGRRDFWTAIRADAKRGRTILFATHYLEEADSYADRIVLMRQGEIVADGTTSQIKNIASGRVVRATLTNSEALSLDTLPGVTKVETRGDSIHVHCSNSDHVARYLLTCTDAHDLEIQAEKLETAFVALTTSQPSAAGGMVQ
jgi:ABC-2 type transport system ATP-binding protein